MENAGLIICRIFRKIPAITKRLVFKEKQVFFCAINEKTPGFT